MDAVILARVSSKEQEEGLSLDAQSARLTEYAIRKGFNVVQQFVLTESSVHGNRRGFYSVIKYLKHTTKPTALIADAVDRVQRTFSEIGMLDELRKKKGIELHFYRENLIINNQASSQDIMRWEFAVLAAHSYVLALSENVKRSISHKLAKGEISGHAPFGYKNIRVNGVADIVPDPDVAPYVRKLFEIYAEGGHSYKEMAKMLNGWGVRIGPSKRKLDSPKILYVLSNRFYYGEYERDGKIIPLRYTPIIPRALWEQAERIRKGRAVHSPRVHRQYSPYRGILKCANSGRLCQFEIHKGTIYVCGYTPDGGRKYIPMEDIDEQVAQILDSIRPSDAALGYIKDTLRDTKLSEAAWRESEIKRLTGELGDIKRRQDALVDMYLDKKIDQDAYQTKLEQFKARETEIKNAMSDHSVADDNFNDTVVNLMNFAHNAGQIFRESSNIELKSQLLRLCFRTMILNGKNIGYELNFPFCEMQLIPNISRWGG